MEKLLVVVGGADAVGIPICEVIAFGDIEFVHGMEG